MPDYPDPGTYGTMTISNTALPITATIHTPTSGSYVGHQPFMILISPKDGDIRYTLEGTTPVGGTGSAVGHFLGDGDSTVIYGKPAMMKMQMIRNASTDVTVAITCFF